MKLLNPLLLLAALTLPVLAEGAAYLKLGDIKGETMAGEHGGWIELQSITPMQPPATGGSGEIKLSKRADKTSPKLAQAVANGTQFPAAELHLSASPQGPFAKYVLSNVVISSFQAGGGSAMPTESFSLNYGAIQLRPDDARPGGSAPSSDRSGHVKAFPGRDLSAGATPKDIYELIKHGKGQMNLSGPVTTQVRTREGKSFDLTVNPDGSLHRAPKELLIVGSKAQVDKETRVPVTTAEGLGFDLVLTVGPDGTAISLLLPAIQRVREAATR